MDSDTTVGTLKADEQAPQDIILFDGVCNLCNSGVNFIIDHDPAARYQFASLQSEAGRQLLEQYGIDPNKTDSMVLIRKGKAYVKSRAALEIGRYLNGLYPMLYAFRIVPSFMADMVYDTVARNRYRWFGREDSCRMPDPELASRFLG